MGRKKKECEGVVPPFSEKELLNRLKKHFPNPKTELNFRNPFELLIVVVLSAQTTDVKVNQVSPKLFEKYPDPESLAKSKNSMVHVK